jgi:hypothetical protein
MEKKKFLTLHTGTLPINSLFGVTSLTVQIGEKFLPNIKLTLLDATFEKLKINTAKFGLLIQNYKRGSTLTSEIKDADKIVGHFFSELKRNLTTDKMSSDVFVSSNAIPLCHAIKSYWNITHLKLITQMEKMLLLFARIDSSAALTNNLLALNYGTLWSNLKQAAATLKSIYDNRITEIGAKGDAPFTMRGEVASNYDIFCDLILRAISAAPSENLELLFDEMNEVRRSYAPEAKKNILHHIRITDIPDQKYTGEYLSPVADGVFYTDADGKQIRMRAGKDFINTYEDNIKPGAAWIIFHGRGKYTGKVSFSFSIVI